MKFLPTVTTNKVSVDTDNEYMIHDTFRNKIRQIKPEIQNRNVLEIHLKQYKQQQEHLKHEVIEKTVGLGAAVNVKMEKYLLNQVA
jgi:hypothetical protein